MELTEKDLKLVEQLVEIMVKQAGIEDGWKKQLEKIVSEKMYGPGVVDKRVNVRWGSLFKKSLCPVCGEKIGKTEKKYSCKKCGLEFPVEVYEKAREEHKIESTQGEKEYDLREKMKKDGLSPEKMSYIYDLAVERSDAVIERMKRKDEG